MNCEQARALMPDLLYPAEPAAQPVAWRQHVDQCPACAEAWRGLTGVRQLLDAAPPPAVRVDLPLLYQEARGRDQRRQRRWRRLAWAASAAAALLLVVTALRFEIRWREGELVLGWGAARPAPPLVVPPEPAPPSTAALADLQLVKDLIHSVVAEMEERNQDHAAAVTELEQRLAALQATSQRRWTATQNDFRALYTAYFGVREKGAMP